MLKKSTSQKIIGQDEFRGLTRPLIGLPVSRVWRGHGSAVFLEIGRLFKETHTWANGTRHSTVKGQFGIMIEWSWRVEKARSIYFGSWSTDRMINSRLPKLEGKTVREIQTEGRLPELVIQLSGGLWVHSFATAEGQPEWCLFLDRKQFPHTWLKSERGNLLHERSLAE